MAGSSPGKITQSRLALMPDGSLAEAALDTEHTAWARWYTGGNWGTWHLVGSNAIDVSITAANVSSSDTAYVSIAHKPPTSRSVYSLTSSAVTATSL
jgi:hypothetical protein